MKLSTKYIRNSIIELTVETHNTTIVTNICDLYGMVDDEFISDLKHLAMELEEHNENVKQKNK